jgi:signal transduction histidine kinase
VLRLKDLYSPILSSLGISFRVEIPESLSSFKISMDNRQNIYLIFKEAINNCIKYSHARDIKFKIEVDNNLYQISLIDDGCGFDKNKIRSGGNGFINMKKRADSLAADYIVESVPGKGTIITLKGKN